MKGNPETQFQSGRQAVEAGRKGGIASGEAKRRRKTFAEAFEAFLASDHTDKKGVTKNGLDILSEAVLGKAVKGDLKAFELIRDTVGEKPVEKVAKVEISAETRSKVDALVSKYESGNGNQDS